MHQPDLIAETKVLEQQLTDAEREAAVLQGDNSWQLIVTEGAEYQKRRIAVFGTAMRVLSHQHMMT
jgi:hypothetical protein